MIFGEKPFSSALVQGPAFAEFCTPWRDSCTSTICRGSKLRDLFKKAKIVLPSHEFSGINWWSPGRSEMAYSSHQVGTKGLIVLNTNGMVHHGEVVREGEFDILVKRLHRHWRLMLARNSFLAFIRGLVGLLRWDVAGQQPNTTSAFSEAGPCQNNLGRWPVTASVLDVPVINLARKHGLLLVLSFRSTQEKMDSMEALAVYHRSVYSQFCDIIAHLPDEIELIWRYFGLFYVLSYLVGHSVPVSYELQESLVTILHHVRIFRWISRHSSYGQRDNLLADVRPLWAHPTSYGGVWSGIRAVKYAVPPPFPGWTGCLTAGGGYQTGVLVARTVHFGFLLSQAVLSALLAWVANYQQGVYISYVTAGVAARQQEGITTSKGQKTRMGTIQFAEMGALPSSTFCAGESSMPHSSSGDEGGNSVEIWQRGTGDASWWEGHLYRSYGNIDDVRGDHGGAEGAAIITSPVRAQKLGRRYSGTNKPL
ncbi:hypothetical protein BKA70DRAFT_1218959 [Coprinopsis sp. MPI-PUGE-AT-0042]|nr:hypothetical protein BKA70DRAFT_1218959 [Coprinopsis sp. MPI-PUGE-AT-0042]